MGKTLGTANDWLRNTLQSKITMARIVATTVGSQDCNDCSMMRDEYYVARNDTTVLEHGARQTECSTSTSK
jgi:hypothetical protein